MLTYLYYYNNNNKYTLAHCNALYKLSSTHCNVLTYCIACNTCMLSSILQFIVIIVEL